MRATDFKDGPTDVVRITLTNADGTVQEFEVTGDFHLLLGFAKCGPHGGKNVPMEILAKGSAIILGELFFRLGDRHPELLDHCARRVMEKTRARLKARGIDPGAKEFENAPVRGGTH